MSQGLRVVPTLGLANPRDIFAKWRTSTASSAGLALPRRSDLRQVARRLQPM